LRKSKAAVSLSFANQAKWRCLGLVFHKTMIARHIHARIMQESGIPKAFADMSGAERDQIIDPAVSD
jgi:hypothetical protein